MNRIFVMYSPKYLALSESASGIIENIKLYAKSDKIWRGIILSSLIKYFLNKKSVI